MISKTVINLLEDEGVETPADMQPGRMDAIFAPPLTDEKPLASEPSVKAELPTAKKLDILGWAAIDRQLRSYGFSKLDDLCLNLIDEDCKKQIADGNSNGGFDFRSDAVSFAVKYNVAIALSNSEAIGILSNPDACEIYASAEVEQIFRKYGRRILPGLSTVRFDEFPLGMQKELVWPMVQNLYRALTIRKAAQAFPEGISGKLAYEALIAGCENAQLASQLSHLDPLKYSDYETLYFTDPSDLEVKYHVAVYCLNHIGEIKPAQKSDQETPAQENKPENDDEQQHAENVKKLEEEYVTAFKRINKNKSFRDRINLEDIFEMGKDVVEAIKEEMRNFAQLKQGIISVLAGRSEVAVEDEELVRILRGKNPDFEFTAQYLAMFFQPSDYYTILGLNSAESPTEKDVKNAFKRQAKIYHPDKNSNDPNKDEKEARFKLLMAAKDALLKRLKAGNEAPSSFRDDVSPASYLGSMSKLFGEYAHADYQKNTEVLDTHQAETISTWAKEETGMDIDENTAQEPADAEEEYLGPYFEEMRILGSMIDGWTGKEVLIMGAGREPDEFSIPVILSRMGATVSAVDANYRGPAEYEGCQYYRLSADRATDMFEQEQFDVVISTGMFGAPFTNWAIREYALNSFDESLKERIRELELEVLEKLLTLTKTGGAHFHHNRDMNPQSWNFDENDLKQIGCESASHGDDLPSPEESWFLKK